MTHQLRGKLLATGAAGVGLSALLAPRLVCRFAGSPPEGAAVWALRLLGARDLCLAALLWTLPSRREQRVLRRLITASQAVDLGTTVDLLRRDQVSRRLGVLVAGAALGTVALSGWPR